MQLSDLQKKIADDAFAASFQTMGQYRSALLKDLAGVCAQANARPVAAQQMPTPDQLRAIAREARNTASPSDEPVRETYVLAGWRAAMAAHPEASTPDLIRLFTSKAEAWCKAVDTLDAHRIECEAVEAFKALLTRASAATMAEPGDEATSYKRMFHAACADLGLINKELGLDPNQGGAQPILAAIREFKRERDNFADDAFSLAASAPGLSEDAWLALAERHASADWNSEQPDGYLNAVKALVHDAMSLTRASAATVAEPSTDAVGGLKAQATITLRQAESLLQFFGGHDAEVAIAQYEGGLIAWCTECPEEGSFWLGKTEVDDELADKGRPQAALQQAEPGASVADGAARFVFLVDGVLADILGDELTPQQKAMQEALSHPELQTLDDVRDRIDAARVGAPTQQQETNE